jgi:hypothetical protein
MHAGKTLRRPGATPLWTAFSRPNPCGVAPGLSPQNGDRVLPACIQKCKQTECRVERSSNTERSKYQWRS